MSIAATVSADNIFLLKATVSEREAIVLAANGLNAWINSAFCRALKASVGKGIAFITAAKGNTACFAAFIGFNGSAGVIYTTLANDNCRGSRYS